MDLPAVVHDVPTAVVVSCGGKGLESSGSSGLVLIKTSAHEGWNIFGRIWEFFCLTGRAVSLRSHWSWCCKPRCWKLTLQFNQCSKIHDRWVGLIQDGKKDVASQGRGASYVPTLVRLTHLAQCDLINPAGQWLLFFSLNEINEVTQEEKKNHPSVLFAAKSPLHSGSSCKIFEKVKIFCNMDVHVEHQGHFCRPQAARAHLGNRSSMCGNTHECLRSTPRMTGPLGQVVRKWWRGQM